MSSRLFVSIRERMGWAYHISSEASLFTDRGWLVTDAGVPHNRIGEVISSVLAEYRRIAKEEVSSEELEGAKEYSKGTFLRGLDDLENLAYFYGSQEMLLNRIMTPEEEMEDCLKVGAGEIRDVAAKIFRPENLNLAIVGPFKSGRSFAKILDNWYL